MYSAHTADAKVSGDQAHPYERRNSRTNSQTESLAVINDALTRQIWHRKAL